MLTSEVSVFFCEAEVNQVYHSCFIYCDVLRFQVAMYEAQLVECLDTVKNLNGDLDQVQPF